MYENRTVYPKKKAKMYQELQEIPKKYKVLALVNMDKVRASQILSLRKKLKDQAIFYNIKDRIAKKALADIDVPGIKNVIEKITGQCMLILTDISPFKLNVLLIKNKIMLAARAGDIASIDVIVREKNTGIAPGPMLTEFKEAGIPTKIDQGTIWIMKQVTPVKKGQVIPEKLAPLLTKLDIKPVEAGISLEYALEEGSFYTRDEMVIDVEKIREEFSTCHQGAINLSVEAGYVTAENVTVILSKAAQSARNVSVEAGFMTDETKDTILQKAHSQAQGIASKAKKYTPS